MKSSAILINTARGGLVDEAALVEALLNKSLAGAGLDCLSSEPPPVDHPLLVLDSPRLLITPHCAWGAIESRRRLVAQLKENILGFFAGHDIRIVV
jgi:glycerate dehydrogenase